MSSETKSFKTTLYADDPVIRDHQVHGVRILPGVTFLDMILRAAEACGWKTNAAALRRVLFHQPVAIGVEGSRTLRLRMEKSGEIWKARIESRDLTGKNGAVGKEKAWELHAEAEVHKDEGEGEVEREAVAMAFPETEGEDIDLAYAKAREVGIVHQGFMKPAGRVWVAEGVVTARLELGEEAAGHLENFLLHPALLDSATVLASFPLPARSAAGDPNTFIPIYIEEFRAVDRFGGKVWVRATVPELPEGAVDAYHQDIRIYNEAGKLAAVFTRLTAKRIRDNSQVWTPAPQGLEPVEGLEQVVAYLQAVVASVRRAGAGPLEPSTGFYDQGLDSSELLKVVGKLEADLGRTFYPTLLFEYSNLGVLAEYLMKEAEVGLSAVVARTENRKNGKNEEWTGAERVVGEAEKRARAEDLGATGRRLNSQTGTSAPREVEWAKATGKEVAIIGFSGRFPEARDLRELWANLRAGRDCIREVPRERWDTAKYFDAAKGKRGKTYSKWGGWVEGHDCFDARFFRIAPRDAERMDPQERLFLETSWSAIEDAGYRPQDLARSAGGKVGVFAGVMWSEYQLFAGSGTEGGLLGRSWQGSIANRVSYFLNFKGPSLAVDTMCSSSLLAVHLACRSLLEGECGAAVAGGVNLSLHPNKYLQLAELEMLSVDGRCRSFGEGGSGYVPGEGVGAVVLKPLARALADGDAIYAVIKGSAVNHGGATGGFTVPSPQAQTEVILAAWEAAQVEGESLSYIEAHGTGTSLGDPIEIGGLMEAFARRDKDEDGAKHLKDRSDPQDRESGKRAMGSVKSNLGHLESAAGISALAKVVLQMQAGELAPSLHAEKLNSRIRWEDAPVEVQRELGPWKRPTMPGRSDGKVYSRRAGISSFGAGGTNVHMVLEEAPWREEEIGKQGRAEQESAGAKLFVLSAKNRERLKESALRLRDFVLGDGVGAGGRARLEDIALTLRIGRVAMEARLAVIAASREELARGLNGFIEERPEVGGVYWGEAGMGGNKSGEGEAVGLEDLAKRWVAGADLAGEKAGAIEGELPEGKGRRVWLPAYPFARERHWLGDAVKKEEGREGRASDRKAGVTGMEGRVEEALVRQVSDLLKMKREEINPSADISEFGFDSVTITRFSERLQELYGIELNASRFFEQSSIRSFAKFLCEEHGAALARHYDGIEVGAAAAARESGQRELNSNEGEPGGGGVLLEQGSLLERRKTDLIAIIGMSGRFPKSDTLEEFWANLSGGKNLVSEVPADRWDWRKHYGDASAAGNRTLCKWGGFLPDIRRFDALFFGISPREAELMDPQQRLFLEAAWSALEGAGYRPPGLNGSRTGVFVGVGTRDYNDLLVSQGGEIQAHQSTGTAHCMVANRVSFVLNLKGPSEAIDTACSSSLVAVHRAVQSLQAGDCDLAIAGGVNALLSPGVFVAFSKSGMLSPEGRCKTFDGGADGYVRGEGVGAVVLKPLARALEDGDTIHAVIRGSAVNHGGRANSLTAPNPNAQAELLIAAYERAGIDLRTVGYIETHGTGTRLGDPVEINALKKALRYFDERGKGMEREGFRCGLGSVKTNVGHLETAAGMAGLIKVILSLQNKTIPASLHFEKLNPLIELEGTPFYIADQTRPWERFNAGDGTVLPRRAGVSSFGFGGTNAHVILEEYEDEKGAGAGAGNEREGELTSAVQEGEAVVVVISAKSPEQLAASLERLRVWVGGAAAVAGGRGKGWLESLAYTLQVGRESMPWRAAMVARDARELLEKLNRFAGGERTGEGMYCGEARLEAAGGLSFEDAEGQMYVDLLWERKKWDRLAELWVKGANLAWERMPRRAGCRRIPLPTYPFGGERYWALGTETAAVSERVETDESAGHPWIGGEESAKGGKRFRARFSLDDFYLRDHQVRGTPVLPAAAILEWARAAGERACGREIARLENVQWLRPITVDSDRGVMIECGSGAGAAGNVFEYRVLSCGSEVVFGRGRVVPTAGEAREGKRLDLGGVRSRMTKSWNVTELYQVFEAGGLRYGGTFRTIGELASDGGEALARLELSGDALARAKEFELNPALLDGAMQSVLGVAGIGAADGEERALYLPASVESLEIFGELPRTAYAYLVRCGRPDERDGNGKGVGAAVAVDVWLTDSEGRVLVEMKKLTFVRAGAGAGARADGDGGRRDGKAELVLMEPRWVEMGSAAGSGEPAPGLADRRLENWLLFDDGAEREAHWLRRWGEKGEGGKIVRVRRGKGFGVAGPNLFEVDPSSKENFQELFGELKRRGEMPGVVVYAWSGGVRKEGGEVGVGKGERGQECPRYGAGGEGDERLGAGEGLVTFFLLLQAIGRLGGRMAVQCFHIWNETGGGTPLELAGEDARGTMAWESALSGIGMTAAQEHPNLRFQSVRFAEAEADFGVELERLERERGQTEIFSEVRYASGKRWVRDLRPIIRGGAEENGEGVQFRKGGVYLITGGAGGLGLHVARFLARVHQAKLVLAGRSELKKEQREILAELNKNGAEAIYQTCDVAKRPEAEELVAACRERFGELNGVIHGAGVIRDALLVRKDAGAVREVLRPKVNGVLNLDEATRAARLDLFINFSSLAGYFGNPGQSDYAAASRFLDAFAEAREEQRRRGERFGKTISVNWPWWVEGGMPMPEEHRKAMRERAGLEPLDTESGMRAMVEALGAAGPQVMVAKGDWNKIERIFCRTRATEIVKEAPTARPVVSGEERRAAGMESGASAGRGSQMSPEAVELFLAGILAPVFKLAPERIEPGESLAKYGIDSFLILSGTKVLEEIFGALPKTLFFEHLTIRELAGYFSKEHSVRLRDVLGRTPAGARSGRAVSSSANAAEEGGARSEMDGRAVESRGSILIHEDELGKNPELARTVEEILGRYGHEGAVAVNRRILAPWIFLGAKAESFFYLNRSGNGIFVWAHVGSPEGYEGLVRELEAWDSKWEVDFLTAEEEGAVLRRLGYTTTPIGVLQVNTELGAFGLAGKSMQRLRYQINHFTKDAECQLAEYHAGVEEAQDNEVIEVVEGWVKLKGQRMPMVELFLKGVREKRLAESYRVFLTRRDGRLENAIVITRVAPRNGYLMDLEFYREDMPLGGLEFGIWQIMEVLKKEGAAYFSLGATLGTRLSPHPSADAGVEKILKEVHDSGMLNGDGNFQFKSKFRFAEVPLFIARKAGRDAGSFVNLLMLLADPTGERGAGSGERGAGSGERGVGSREGGAGSGERVEKLERAQFNVMRLEASEVEFDLKTDSWGELAWPTVQAEVQRLRHQRAGTADLEGALRKIFGFPHFVVVNQGRNAEALLWERLARPGARVLQSSLFPTYLYHQVRSGISAEEIPIWRLGEERGSIFLGNIDLAALKQRSGESGLKYVCLELGNNATGGMPVSLRNLREARAWATEHGLKLFLDGTRLLENAVLVQEHEEGCAGMSIWEIVREFGAQADGMTASLSKDFGVNTGGIVAVRDEELWRELERSAQLNGNQLNLENREFVARGLADLGRVENLVRARMNHVRIIGAALREAGAPVLWPAGGHCVLVNAAEAGGAPETGNSASALLAWMYARCGIRAGVHSVGKERQGPEQAWVRLAVPLALEERDVRQMAERLKEFFKGLERVPRLKRIGRGEGGLGEVLAGYEREDAWEWAGGSAAVEEGERRVAVGGQKEVEVRLQAPAATGEGKEERIAVIGMAGRYPKAGDLEQFWANLKNGVNCITEIPAERWDYRQFKNAEGKVHSRYGGFVDDYDKFDPLLFGISPVEAEVMDPQERLFLETAWAALEDAGYPRDRLQSEPVYREMGVYVGVVWSLYQLYGVEEALKGNVVAPNSFHWSIANRVSHVFDLNGPSLAVDTACSASLMALHLACGAIRRGECGMALVGGVNLELHPSKGLIIDASKMVSSEGKCRSFGAGGDGYVVGEGVGAVLLKKLDDALRDGDRIDGVILGTATNHGGKTNGFTVPNPKLQGKLIAKALAAAGVEARSMSYIEAHGTGTPLGDPIEIAGLTQAFRGSTGDNQFCAIGSVKSNIGHLEAAAGIAGLTKVLLQFRHRELAPSLHAETLSPNIQFQQTPFYVQRRLEKWGQKKAESGGNWVPLRAGLSSFGAGGTNVHVILEEAPAEAMAREAEKARERRGELVVLSARSEERLREHARRIGEFFRAHAAGSGSGKGETDEEKAWFEDAAFTLQRGREAMEYRMAFWARSAEEAAEQLEKFCKAHGGKVAGIFTGKIRRERERRKNDDEAQAETAAADGGWEKSAACWVEGAKVDWMGLHRLRRPRNLSLPNYPFARKRIWIGKSGVGNGGNPERENERTWAHPLIDRWERNGEECRFYKRLNGSERYLRDHVVAGEPILPGAAVVEMARAAGVLYLDLKAEAGADAALTVNDLVWANPVRLGKGAVELELVVRRSEPGRESMQFELISRGEQKTEEADGERMHARGKLCRRRQSDGGARKKVDCEEIRRRCVSGAGLEGLYASFRAHGLEYGPAFQTIRKMWCGPGEVLAELKGTIDEKGWVLEPCLLDGALQAVAGAMRSESAAGSGAGPYVPFSLGELVLFGRLETEMVVHARLADLKGSGSVRRFDISILTPGGELLAEIRQFGIRMMKSGATVAKAPERGEISGAEEGLMFCKPGWRLVTGEAEEKMPGGQVVMISLSGGGSSGVIEACRRSWGDRVVTVCPGSGYREIDGKRFEIELGKEADYAALVGRLEKGPLKPSAVVCVSFAEAGGVDGARAVQEELRSFFFLSKALLKSGRKEPVKLFFVSAGEVERVHCRERVMGGFARSLAVEARKLELRVISFVSGSDGGEGTSDADRNACVAGVARELGEGRSERVLVRYCAGERWEWVAEAFDGGRALAGADGNGDAHAAAGLVRKGGNYLITGGRGGLGRIFGDYLLGRGAGHVILVGRRPGGTTGEKRSGDEAAGLVRYYAADVSDRAACERVMAQISDEVGPIHGVLHAAGVLRDGFVVKKEWADVQAVLGPKLAGVLNLDAVTAGQPLDFFVMFSSIASTFGNLGQTDYSAANGFLDYFATHRERLRASGERRGRTVSVCWPLWKEGGMRIPAEQEVLMEKRTGMRVLGAKEGLRAFELALAGSEAQVVVLGGDVGKMKEALKIVDGDRGKPRIGAEANGQAGVERLHGRAGRETELGESGGKQEETKNVESESRLPIGNVEEAIVGMLVEFLKVERGEIDLDADFGEFGIDSIMMMKMLDRVEKMYGRTLDPNVMMEYSTTRALAGYLVAEGIATAGMAGIAPRETQEKGAVAGEVALAGDADGGTARVKNGGESRGLSEGQRELAVVGPRDGSGAAAGQKFAVIGMACRLPKSPSVEAFWENLTAGRDLISEIPGDRWPLEDYYDSDKGAPRKSYSKWGGFIEGVDLFDAKFFGVSADNALTMDPQQRILLELTLELFERSGYSAKEISGTRTGIFIGGGMNSYCTAGFAGLSERQMQHIIVNRCPNMMAARLADFFNLKGPAMTTDTACSSSLVAIHQACQSMARGESEAAVVGGIELLLDPFYHIGFSKAQVLSDDGVSYVFDERAKGFVLGEGAGLALIKPLEQAVRDGDRIHAVILGSAINNDGRTMGVTVPNLEAQKEVIDAAIRGSGVDPGAIGYLEAHGTGTLLGDPIEIKAATQVFRKYTQERQYCAVGSVKSNMGHLCRAAGVASFLKVVLALENRWLPATLHCEKPHPRFRFESSPFYPIAQSRAWEARAGGWRAAVSSFGFGGTNCHIILERPSAELIGKGKREPSPLTRFCRERFWQLEGKNGPKDHGMTNGGDAVLSRGAMNRKLVEDLKAGRINPRQAAALFEAR